MVHGSGRGEAKLMVSGSPTIPSWSPVHPSAVPRLGAEGRVSQSQYGVKVGLWVPEGEFGCRVLTVEPGLSHRAWDGGRVGWDGMVWDEMEMGIRK